MANELRPGGIGDKTDDPNQDPANFVNSMAKAIEDALNKLLLDDYGKGVPVNNNSKETRDRRRLLVAIAQGVIRHLVDNAAAFEIVDAANNPTGEKIRIHADTTLI